MIRIIVLALLLGFSVSCSNDKASSKKNTPSKVGVTTTKGKKSTKKAVSVKQWTNIKNQLGLTNQQVDKLTKIDAAHAKTVKRLKKQKKWTGTDNSKTRKKISNKRKSDIVKIIGQEKYTSAMTMLKRKS